MPSFTSAFGNTQELMLLQTSSVSIPVLFVLFPRVSGNHIFQGQAAGIAVNENGRGLITGV